MASADGIDGTKEDRRLLRQKVSARTRFYANRGAGKNGNRAEGRAVRRIEPGDGLIKSEAIPSEAEAWLNRGHYGAAEEGLKKSLTKRKAYLSGFRGCGKSSSGGFAERPGLKPLEFAGIFAGLKPCAPTEKHKARIFPQTLKPR